MGLDYLRVHPFPLLNRINKIFLRLPAIAIFFFKFLDFSLSFQVGWLVGCFGLNGPLRQYFSLYRAVSQREGEKKEK